MNKLSTKGLFRLKINNDELNIDATKNTAVKTTICGLRKQLKMHLTSSPTDVDELKGERSVTETVLRTDGIRVQVENKRGATTTTATNDGRSRQSSLWFSELQIEDVLDG